jgi:hypothetical protein
MAERLSGIDNRPSDATKAVMIAAVTMETPSSAWARASARSTAFARVAHRLQQPSDSSWFIVRSGIRNLLGITR